MIFFRQIFLFLVRNDQNWSSLLRCITLNARVYSLTLVSASATNIKTPSISLTYPKCLLKTSTEERSMILHTASDSFAILKHKQWKWNGKNSNTDHFHHEFIEKLRKYDLLFSRAKRLAICSVRGNICFSDNTQHLEVAGTLINGRQFARICWIKEMEKSRISKIERIGTRHHPPPTRGEKRMRKASVIRVIKPILCSSYNVTS